MYIKFCKANFLETATNFGFLKSISSLFISRNHQVTDEITLSLPVENIAISPNVPTFFHQISAPNECAQSSITSKS